MAEKTDESGLKQYKAISVDFAESHLRFDYKDGREPKIFEFNPKTPFRNVLNFIYNFGVLGLASSQHSRGSDPTELSEAELKVWALIALGQANKEIARALVLSKRTVDAHTSHILSKLDVRSRTEAALQYPRAFFGRNKET